MIGIYVRQSLDKKDSLSIETQIDFCKKEITDATEYKVFQDKGFSGKNIDRPAFIKLLKAVENNEISKIIVYRLDRISRSITDFANIIDILEAHKVDFISANEKFDTSMPVGRAMLYIIMIFAQLERETIAERIKDNYYSRGKTGVWLGGPAPFGFTNIKITDKNKKTATLSPNGDIEIIKEIYDMYANSDASLGRIAKLLLSKYGVMWNNIKLSRILHNPVYVKADADIYNYFRLKNCVIINEIEEFTGLKGCNLYGKRDKGVNKYKCLDEQILALGLHNGVIASETWLRCQYKLEHNKQIKNTGKGKHTWLTGLVKCGYCGYGMNVKIYGDYKYFNCTGRYLTDLCIEKLSTHHVNVIETYVEAEIKKFSDELKNRKISKTDIIDNKSNQLKIELYNVEQKIDKLLESLISSNSVLTGYINDKIIELDKQRNVILNSLTQKSVKETPSQIPDISDWTLLNSDFKKEIAGKLIQRILVFNDKLEIIWKY